MSCTVCLSTGLVEAMSHDAGARTVMRCECQCGEAESWKLPKFSKQWSAHFNVTALDYGSVSAATNVNALVERWQARIQVAEDFWRYHEQQKTWGNVFEPEAIKRWYHDN